MRESFMHRLDEKNKYAFEVTHIEAYRSYFTFDFGAGEIRPVFIVNLEQILPAWKKYLLSKQLLHDENFETNELKVSDDKVSYKNLTADRIIFSNGHHAAEQSWFNRLPFAPNKGEIIIAEIPGLPADHIYKKGMVMVPLSTKDHWWIGSDYKWEFEDAQPTKEFRDRIESLLRNWLKLPFKVIDHFAGIRPATLERRPFVGMHPVYKNLGIFNGMGTKGCSLAPFFAKEYVDHLTNNKQITPDADVNRFKNILSR
jgi:glycine/D-amino acid oxidase-like deaminating enzyme